jgi:hypothetical protein
MKGPQQNDHQVLMACVTTWACPISNLEKGENVLGKAEK